MLSTRVWIYLTVKYKAYSMRCGQYHCASYQAYQWYRNEVGIASSWDMDVCIDKAPTQGTLEKGGEHCVAWCFIALTELPVLGYQQGVKTDANNNKNDGADHLQHCLPRPLHSN